MLSKIYKLESVEKMKLFRRAEAAENRFETGEETQWARGAREFRARRGCLPHRATRGILTARAALHIIPAFCSKVAI